MDLNPFVVEFPSSTSSSDEEEIWARREQQNREINDMIFTVSNTYVPILMSLVTATSRRPGGRFNPRADRGREEGHVRLHNDYFGENPVYGSTFFRRRFRMQNHIFERIMSAVVADNPWFQQKRNAAGRLGLSPLQKYVATIRQITYGLSADACDEYIRISLETSRLALKAFTEGVINHFGNEYLRRPTQSDLERLLQIGEARGFSRMIGSIDCMHWEWKNCPTAWKGQYQDKAGVATLVLEAVADQDTWIWHSSLECRASVTILMSFIDCQCLMIFWREELHQCISQ